MLTNRKIRKAIKSELQQPPPFDGFCREAGIEFPVAQKVKPKRRRWIPAVSAAVASAAIVCGCIPLMLPKNSQDGTVELPKFAGKDVIYSTCDISEIQANTNIVLFDLCAIQQLGPTYSIYPSNNEKLCLAYNTNDVIYEKQIDETLYSYIFDYMARTYKYFEFIDLWRYEALTEHYEYNGAIYNYNINYETAYISFSAGENDYFISLHGRDGITEIDRESVETFIEIAF